MRAWFGRLAVVMVGLLGLAALVGSGGGEDRTKAHVRLVNASSGFDALSLDIDGDRVTTAAAYGESAAYTDVDRGSGTAEVFRPASPTVLSTTSVDLGRNDSYTMLAYGKSGALGTVLLDENAGTPASGKTLLRVINTASDAGALDVYVTAAGDALADSSPVQTGAAYGSLGGFITLNSGTWRLRATATNSKTDLRLDFAALALGSESVATLVLTPGRGGVLVNALLIVQRGGIAVLANPQARVRAVAGVSDGGAVTAAVGTSTLITGVGSPSLTNYQLVSAGTVSVTASADGNAAAAVGASLVGGGDYTVLVYGPPTAPRAVLLVDDNTRPTVGSQTKVRLVHGLADSADALALKVDFLSVSDGVAQGSASAYATVDSSTAAQVDVTSGATTVYSAADRVLDANSIYSVFVLGPVGSATGIVRKDR